jgi:hypothetical protein
MAVYAGFPAALNGMFTAKEIFSFISFPLFAPIDFKYSNNLK